MKREKDFKKLACSKVFSKYFLKNCVDFCKSTQFGSSVARCPEPLLFN